MSDLNKVMIIGRLGQDPEIKYTASGAAIANLNVATTDKWRDKQTGEMNERTEWHRVVFFGRIAEVLSEYASKGTQVFVEGKLQTDKWTDNNGVERYTTKVVGSDLKLLGGKPAQQQGGGFRKKPEPVAEEGQEDIPF